MDPRGSRASKRCYYPQLLREDRSIGLDQGDFGDFHGRLSFDWLFRLPALRISIPFLPSSLFYPRYWIYRWSNLRSQVQNIKGLKPYLRLAMRGLKLLVLFTFLNVFNCILIEHDFIEGLFAFGEKAQRIFFSGNGRVGIFEVLLPISYFLLLSPLLLWLRANLSFTIPLIAGGSWCFALF